jgi:hypothetical protein
MKAGDIKQIADECGQIETFIHKLDSWGNAEIAVTQSCIDPVPIMLCSKLSGKLWPGFRKQLVAKYNELAATINADKFFDPTGNPNISGDEEFTADDAHHALTGE